MMRAAFGALLITVFMAVPAGAQSGTGVSVALVGDIARFNGSDTEPSFPGGFSRDGEALGFSIRLDRQLGSRWGVELEYVRGGEMETESRLVPFPASELAGLVSRIVPIGSVNIGSSSVIFPPRQTQTNIQSRFSTISTLAWFRQSIGERTSLVYSAGVAFGIEQAESTYFYIGLPNELTLPAVTTEYTSYSIHPVVGFDARVAMTDHASLVPGIRVVGSNGGLIVRPSVGLRWEF
jgi:opacity protein-like surface antigen